MFRNFGEEGKRRGKKGIEEKFGFIRMLIWKRGGWMGSFRLMLCYTVTFSSTKRRTGGGDVKTRIGGGGLIKLHASFPRRGDLFPIDATGFTPPSSL